MCPFDRHHKNSLLYSLDRTIDTNKLFVYPLKNILSDYSHSLIIYPLNISTNPMKGLMYTFYRSFDIFTAFAAFYILLTDLLTKVFSVYALFACILIMILYTSIPLHK